ncbi:MAG: hypothetical protein GF311_27510 [Candidatus Lokiarchaeota archaeon]|nr:hypothetical protein [Candidatus Lokiarchaeota archaeon]
MNSAHLVDALERGTLALFLGGDLPQALTGVPSRAEMARALARRHGLETSPSLAQVAQQVGRGGWRRAFTVFLREQLQDASPQSFHRRVVALAHEHGVQTLVSTAYDGLLQRAFDDAGVPVEVVWKDSQLAVAFQDRPLLIQLYGNPLADVESLVVTEDDHLDLWRDRRRASVLDEVKRALQRNTVLFLGYNLSDPDVRLLWREVLGRAGDLHRRAFAVWPSLPAAEVAVWADRGIEILAQDPWGLVDGGVAMRQPPAPATPPPAPSSMPAQLYQQVQRALLRCGPFRSDTALRPLFIDRRISLWHNSLPSANSPIERVQATIEHLFLKSNAEGTNALVLLLRVLRDQTSQGDACYGQLDKLAKKLDTLLKGQGSTAAT